MNVINNTFKDTDKFSKLKIKLIINATVLIIS